MAKSEDVEKLRRRIEVFVPHSKEGTELRDYMLDIMELLWRREKNGKKEKRKV